MEYWQPTTDTAWFILFTQQLSKEKGHLLWRDGPVYNATFQASPPILWHYWTPIVLKGHQNRTLAEFPTLQEFFLSAQKYDFCRSYIVLWLTYIQPQWYTVPLKPSSENKESLESLYSPRDGTTNYILTQAGLPLCCVVLKTLTPTSCVALVVQSVERLECHGFESHQGQLFLFLERVFLVQFAFPTSPCCCHITCISPTKGSSSFFGKSFPGVVCIPYLTLLSHYTHITHQGQLFFFWKQFSWCSLHSPPHLLLHLTGSQRVIS